LRRRRRHTRRRGQSAGIELLVLDALKERPARPTSAWTWPAPGCSFNWSAGSTISASRARPPAGDDWKLGALQLVQTLKRVWDFEMFAVEDSTLIDGKTVTVTYGVTVGKSIGALLLFLLGYWLFALLSRRLQG
jgi:hypothetical protein